MKKLSICIFALHPITYQTPVYELLEKRSKAGSEFSLDVLFGDPLSLKGHFSDEIGAFIKFDKGLGLENFKHRFLKNFSSDPRKGFFSRINLTLPYHLLVGRYDVLVIHGYSNFSSLIALFFAKIFFIKIIFRGEAVLEGISQNEGIVRKLKHKVLPFILQRFDAVMYTCQGNKRYFMRYKVPKSKLFPFPCAVNNDYYLSLKNSFKKSSRNFREELGIGNEKFVIFFCARFTPRKRPLDLITAVSRIDHNDIVTIFIGDGIEKRNMMKAAKENNLNVLFPGFLSSEDIARYALISDIAVTMSDQDNSPKSVNEAMLFELPVIISNVVGTANDLVQDNINGYVLNVGDIKSLGEKIQFLKLNPNITKKMGHKSLQIVSDWSFDADVNGLLSAVHSTKK